MDFNLTQEQLQIREEIRKVCKEFPDAYWREIDGKKEYPEAFVRKLSELGWLAALIPEEYGGQGGTFFQSVLVVEELDRSVPSAQLDPKQLRQAFLNIIKNSFDAMQGGGKLTVSTAQKDGRVEITIGDTGKGISEENLDLIFTPFFSTKHGGTGLGLSITSHIVKEHRGTISFQSHQGLGTAFTIRLPILASPASLGKVDDKKGQPMRA